MITKLSKITSMDNCFIFFFPNNLVDKPGKSRDFYHTCYTLSGLSVAQNMPDGQEAVLGDESNLLVIIPFISGLLILLYIYFHVLGYNPSFVQYWKRCR